MAGFRSRHLSPRKRPALKVFEVICSFAVAVAVTLYIGPTEVLLAICMGHIKLYDKHLYYMCVQYYMSDVLDKGVNCTYNVHSLCYVFISGTQFTLAFKCVGNTTGTHSELLVEILSRGRYHLCDIQCNAIEF